MSLFRTDPDTVGSFPGYEYPYDRQSVGDPEMAYVDVSGEGSETFLCLHGEPTWGYLYRKLIPTLRERGRVIVPDAIGFGRSDKYTDPDEYSFEMHYRAFETFITSLDLQNITLVCQDWGGILGLTLAANHPDRFARLVPMNTGVPTGEQTMPPEWEEFRRFVAETDPLPIGKLIQGATTTDLSDETIEAYEAPFPDEELKAGARSWPDMVPRQGGGDGASMTRAAAEKLGEWDKPAFVLFSRDDPITRDNRDPLREHIPTASEQPDVWIADAGHFLQEDAGEEIATRIVEFTDRT